MRLDFYERRLPVFLKSAECHFVYILLVKAWHGASPDSRRGPTDAASDVRSSLTYRNAVIDGSHLGRPPITPEFSKVL